MDGAVQSVQDVERLVHHMYTARDTQEIARTQEQLQLLQRSPEGWRLADALLSSQDENSRFFGALTFTVKLNIEGPTLSEADAQLILQTLVSWLVKLAARSDSKLALDKLTTTHVTYFVRAPLVWRRPLLYLCHALSGSASQEITEVDLSNCSEQQLLVLLDFATELATELDRIGYAGVAQARLHNELEQEVQLLPLLINAASARNSSRPRLTQAALRAFQAWALYAQSNLASKPEAYQVLREMNNMMMLSLKTPDIREQALHIFTDLLESNTSFFTREQLYALTTILGSSIAPIVRASLADQSEDLVPHIQFVVALGSAIVEDIAERSQQEASQIIIQLLHAVLQADGTPGDTDELSSLTVEFWCTFSEHVTDTMSSYEGPATDLPWLSDAKHVMMSTCVMLWKKMFIPPAHIAKQWSDDEIAAFRGFRTDTEELFNFMYVTLGLDLAVVLVDMTTQMMSVSDFAAVEAGIASLAALSDSLLETEAADVYLIRLLDTNLLQTMADFTSDLPSQVPSQVRKTVIDFVGQYGPFIKRNNRFIPDSVRFLFACLETSSLAITSAKAILELCSSCRLSLVSDLDAFLTQYTSVIALPHVDSYIKEKVIGGISAIIQALPDNSAKVGPLLLLLDNIDRDLQASRQALGSGLVEDANDLGLSALQCLASMGKALQIPEEVPIDLYNEDDSQVTNTYWKTGEGRLVQERIMSCFSILDILGNNGEAIDAACRVLKAGFTEAQPGPFVLPSMVTTTFLQSCTVNTPQVESVLGAAAMLVAHTSQADDSAGQQTVSTVFSCILSFIQELQLPSQDPGVAEACLNVISRMIPAFASILLLAPNLNVVLTFALRAVEGQDLLPKKAALELWTKLIKAASQTQLPTGFAPDMRDRANAVLNTVGQDLTQVLVRQVAGIGRRSDMDAVTEPIKALFTSLPMQAKNWLEVALFSRAFPPVVGAIGEAEKRRFLSQVVGLRGGIRTREIVKTFYAACRGTVSSYV